jgi:hypothetical protein
MNMNKEATSIEKFFRELSRRMYKENDLSDMVYALCRSNSDFMQFFLNFIFGVEKLNASDFRIEREVSFENDRPDFVLTKKDSGERYFIEVKIGDRSQHFAQYNYRLKTLNENVVAASTDFTKYLGYITDYEVQEGELSPGDKTAFNGCKGNGTYHTWSEFKDALYRSKLVGDLNEDIRGLLAYCEMVCPSQQEDEQIEKYTYDPGNFREIKDCYSALEDYLSKVDKIKVLRHDIKIKKDRVANTPAESIGIYFEAQDVTTEINEKDKMCEGKKIWGWAGWLLTKGFHPGFCIAFDNNNGWGAPVFESLNKQDESWMPFCNAFEMASDDSFQKAFEKAFEQIINGKKEDCEHGKEEVNASLYAARALPLYLKQQVFPRLSCQNCIIEPFQQKDSFNPKGWCGEYFAVKTNPVDGEEGRQDGVYWVGTYFNDGKLVCEKIGGDRVGLGQGKLIEEINTILNKNHKN